MAIRRLRWYVWLLIGVILVPPLLWVAVVVVAPTGWAKAKLVAILESRSGRRVGLEGLSVQLLGGIQLTNLEIGSPKDTGDPWLKAADLRMDIGPLQILQGRFQPSRVDVEGIELRVLRRADGSVELADLIRPVPAPALLISGRRKPVDHITIQVRHANVTVLDEPTQTQLHLQDVEGEGYSEGPRAVVDHLRGTLNGGAFRFAAQLDRTAMAMNLKAQFRADDVKLDEGMKILRYFVPILAGAPSTLKGRLNTDFYAQGQGPSWRELCRSIAGHGVIALNPIELDGAPLVAELTKFVDLSGPRRVGSIRTDFLVKDRRITTDQFTWNIARLPITLSGWTDLDGRIDYHMKVEGLNDRLPDRVRHILGDLQVDVGSLTSLTLRGTVNKLVVQVNGVPIDGKLLRDTGLRRDDRERLRLLGRELRDKLLR
jgi:uncharacterized protein involved in outer membrane biogenesis